MNARLPAHRRLEHLATGSRELRGLPSTGEPFGAGGSHAAAAAGAEHVNAPVDSVQQPPGIHGLADGTLSGAPAAAAEHTLQGESCDCIELSSSCCYTQMRNAV